MIARRYAIPGLQVAEHVTPARAPLLRHMEAHGFLPGGEVNERIAHALEGTGPVPLIQLAQVDDAFAFEGLSAESREWLMQR